MVLEAGALLSHPGGGGAEGRGTLVRLIKPRGASLLSIWQAGPPQRGVHRQPFGPNPAPDEVNTFTPWTWRDFLSSQQMSRSDRTRTRAADRTKYCPHAEPSARQQPCPSTSSMAPSNAPHEMPRDAGTTGPRSESTCRGFTTKHTCRGVCADGPSSKQGRDDLMHLTIRLLSHQVTRESLTLRSRSHRWATTVF